jgi:hypothetical protein
MMLNAVKIWTIHPVEVICPHDRQKLGESPAFRHSFCEFFTVIENLVTFYLEIQPLFDLQ